MTPPTRNPEALVLTSFLEEDEASAIALGDPREVNLGVLVGRDVAWDDSSSGMGGSTGSLGVPDCDGVGSGSDTVWLESRDLLLPLAPEPSAVWKLLASQVSCCPMTSQDSVVMKILTVILTELMMPPLSLGEGTRFERELVKQLWNRPLRKPYPVLWGQQLIKAEVGPQDNGSMSLEEVVHPRSFILVIAGWDLEWWCYQTTRPSMWLWERGFGDVLRSSFEQRFPVKCWARTLLQVLDWQSFLDRSTLGPTREQWTLPRRDLRQEASSWHLSNEMNKEWGKCKTYQRLIDQPRHLRR